MHSIGKKLKKLMALASAAALLVLAPGAGSFTSHAADPVTYSVKYSSEDGEWRFQEGSSFSDEIGHLSVSYLLTFLNDGDSIVVYAGDGGFKSLDLGNVKLDNLTIYNGAQAAVTAGGIRECYILSGSYCAVNGDVTSAYLYDDATCTFNNNVRDMTLYFSADKPSSNITCAGTVGHFIAVQDGANNYYLEFYSVSQNAFVIENGASRIPETAYKSEPTNEYRTGQTSQTANSSDDDEYDQVPKTGETGIYPWLFLASALCFAGSIILRKRETH